MNYKKAEALLEFEDLIQIMLHSLRRKKKATMKLQQQYNLIIVDEFQDTDPRQLEFLHLMQARRKIVVGDDWQAIYAFRGASLQPFFDFRRLFQAKVLRLCDNYRSLENIVKLGNCIIKASHKQIRKKVHAVRGAGPGLPVLSYNVQQYGAQSLVHLLHRQTNTDYCMLVRTNWRRIFWLEIGLPEDRIMTIHKSKGLEFPVVFLDICKGWTMSRSFSKNKGFWPFTQDPLWDEEIRILYVGASRAMNLLAILHLEAALTEQENSSRERFYYKKFIVHQAKVCCLPEMQQWLNKEIMYRNSLSTTMA